MQINLDSNVSGVLEREARLSGKSPESIVSNLIKANLQAQATKSALSEKKRITLPTFSSGGLRPGVDLNNREQMWELADSKE